MRDLWWNDHANLDVPLSRRDFLVHRLHNQYELLLAISYHAFFIGVIATGLGLSTWWSEGGAPGALILGAGLLVIATLLWRRSGELWRAVREVIQSKTSDLPR
jgi:hypothetical protein